MSTRRISLFAFVAALCLVVLRAAGLAQSAQAPTFRSTLDLLTIDTSVRDKDGQVVPDLQASDFTVTIDGKPRKVVSAVFFKADGTGGGRLTGGAAPTPQYVSNAGSAPGRVVVFALDSETIRGGQERALFDTASRMLDGLSPADAVGLVEIPGTAIDVTRNHSVVAEALQRFRGRAPHELEHMTPGPAHSAQVLLDLANLVRRLSAIRAPRSVILISGGMTFDTELMAQFRELHRAAAESRVVIYSVLLEQVGYEVSREEFRPEVANNPAKTEGLATIASSTGGMFFNAAARAVGIFDRIQSEVTSFYQLAIESSPADADGKERDVKVRVNRAGVDVRGPTHVATAKPPKVATARDPLLAALQQPTDMPDVPIAVTTYSTHGTGSAIHVLVSAEIGVPGGAVPAEWGFEVRQNGKGVVNTRGTIAGSGRPSVVSTTVEIPPGDYRLRVAAVDAEARVGVLEFPFTAALQKAPPATLSDLIVGVATGGQLEARRRIARSETLTAMLEMQSDTMAGGTLQLIPAGSARAVLTIPLAPRPAATTGGPAILQARASLAAVPAGRYTASAVVEVAGQPATRVDRVVEITGTQPSSPTPDVAAPPVTDAAATKPAPPKVTVDPSNVVPEEVIRSVGEYVRQYGGQASLLVAVEHYSQSVRRAGTVLGGRRAQASDAVTDERRLVSEFALVPNAAASGGWIGYRDVIEMNGKPVVDRGDRLQAIFRSGAPDLAKAKRIADEGARYNIGPVSRNFNVPTTTLFFFDSASLSRFTLRRTGRERIDGLDTIVIDFRETRSPTLIMNSAGKDVPASGTLWVNPVDGAVVRTRLALEKFDDFGSRAVIDVKYQQDKTLEMWVPARMEEKYSGGERETATTVATYKDFKRFQTSIKIK